MLKPAEKIWDRERLRRNQKLERAASVLGESLHDKVVPADMAVRLLEAVIEPSDRVELKRSSSHLFLSNHATSPTHLIRLRPSALCQASSSDWHPDLDSSQQFSPLAEYVRRQQNRSFTVRLR